MKNYFFFPLMLFICSSAMAADDAGYNEYTIRPSDIPADAPAFEDYPTKVFVGPSSPPDLQTDSLTRLYRTQINLGAKQKPNFAGHYIIVSWGCGTDCYTIALVDAINGRVFHPKGVSSNVTTNIDDLLLSENNGSLRYRPDSRLMMLIGMPEEREADRGISYYLWENDKFNRIRFVPKDWYPNHSK